VASSAISRDSVSRWDQTVTKVEIEQQDRKASDVKWQWMEPSYRIENPVKNAAPIGGRKNGEKNRIIWP